MLIIAIIIGIILMVGLFTFFNTYPDPIYFETFDNLKNLPAPYVIDTRYEEPGIF